MSRPERTREFTDSFIVEHVLYAPLGYSPEHTREFTDSFIEREFFARFMRGTPEKRSALIHALQVADTCAREGLDKPAQMPLLEEPEEPNA